MTLGWQQCIDRCRRTLPVGQDVLQASRNKIGDNIDPRFQHHALSGQRPVRHRVSTVGPQTTTRLEVHWTGVRSFESPRQRVLVVAQTKMVVEFAERMWSAATVEIRGRSN